MMWILIVQRKAATGLASLVIMQDEHKQKGAVAKPKKAASATTAVAVPSNDRVRFEVMGFLPNYNKILIRSQRLARSVL